MNIGKRDLELGRKLDSVGSVLCVAISARAVYSGNVTDVAFGNVSDVVFSVANGLNYNRIVTRRKDGRIKKRGSVGIGDNYLDNKASGIKSEYTFKNFADGAFAVWYFLAKRSNYEWALTEFKIDKEVSSRITSIADNMHGGAVVGNEIYQARFGKLIYWVSIHSHPEGGNELSDGQKGKDDWTTLNNIRTKLKYSTAQMAAYDYLNLRDGYGFIKSYRK